MSDENLYRENILEHYKYPRNFGTLGKPDIVFRDTNPLCGDEIVIGINVDKSGKITDVKFSGKGCAISQASASILTDMVKNKTIQDIIKMEKKELLDELGIELSAVRLKCALLSFKVLKAGVLTHLHMEMKDLGDL